VYTACHAGKITILLVRGLGPACGVAGLGLWLGFAGLRLRLFVFGEGEDVIVVVEDGEFGGAVEGSFEALENGDLVLYRFEEAADIRQIYIEQEGAAVGAMDGGERVAEAFDGLKHHRDLSVGHHCPDEGAFALLGDRHGELEAEAAIEVEGGVDVFDEEVGSKGFHGSYFCSNILI